MIYNRTSMKLTSKYDITARRQSVFVVTLDLWTKKRMQQIQMIQDFFSNSRNFQPSTNNLNSPFHGFLHF